MCFSRGFGLAKTLILALSRVRACFSIGISSGITTCEYLSSSLGLYGIDYWLAYTTSIKRLFMYSYHLIHHAFINKFFHERLIDWGLHSILFNLLKNGSLCRLHSLVFMFLLFHIIIFHYSSPCSRLWGRVVLNIHFLAQVTYNQIIYFPLFLTYVSFALDYFFLDFCLLSASFFIFGL